MKRHFEASISSLAGPAWIALLAVLTLWHSITNSYAQSMPWGPDIKVNQACDKCNTEWGDLAVHASGNAIAIRTQNDGTIDVAVARYDANNKIWRGFKTLQESTVRSGSFTKGLSSPKVAMDRNGNAMAAWVNNFSGEIFAARYSASSTTWGAPQLVHVLRMKESDNVIDIKMDPDGNAFVKWEEKSPRELVVRRYNAANQAWDNMFVVAAPSTLLRSVIAVDPFGNAVVVWSRTSDNVLHSRRYNKSTGKWTFIKYVGTARDSSTFNLNIDKNGNGTAIWLSNPSGSQNAKLTAARYMGGTNSWSPSTIVQSIDGLVYFPAIASDTKGNVHVVFGLQQNNTSSTNLHAVRYDVGTGVWGAQQPITSSPSRQFNIAPNIAFDPKDNMVAVWIQRTFTQFDDTGSESYEQKASIRYNATTSTWSSVEVGAKTYDFISPTGLGLDASGKAIALYNQESGYFWNNTTMIRAMNASHLMPTP